MADQKFGPFQQAANKLLQFVVDNKVPNADKIILDGQLGTEWIKAFDLIFKDEVLRTKFDYGALREARDSLIGVCGRWSFVGNIGHSDGHYLFIGFVQRMALLEYRLSIVSWDTQGDKLSSESRRLLDWRKKGELLNWESAQLAS